MGIICETCGRDIDALGQDNMGVDEPLCEDCWNERQSHAVNDLRREVRNLRFENALRREISNLRFENALLCEEPDAATEEMAVQNLRQGIETAYEPNRERALALTKLDECELWLGRCELKETATPAAGSSAQEAAMPCLKADEARGFTMPDVNVEVEAEVTAEESAKGPREAMQPAMRMAVE